MHRRKSSHGSVFNKIPVVVSGIIVLALFLSTWGGVWADPPLPSSFYGEIHISDNPPLVGYAVLAFVPDVTPAVGTATISHIPR